MKKKSGGVGFTHWTCIGRFRVDVSHFQADYYCFNAVRSFLGLYSGKKYFLNFNIQLIYLLDLFLE